MTAAKVTAQKISRAALARPGRSTRIKDMGWQPMLHG
jgi:hypothetical protein